VAGKLLSRVEAFTVTPFLIRLQYKSSAARLASQCKLHFDGQQYAKQVPPHKARCSQQPAISHSPLCLPLCLVAASVITNLHPPPPKPDIAACQGCNPNPCPHAGPRRCSPAQSFASLVAMAPVVTPNGHLLQLAAPPTPPFHSPIGQAATWPGAFR
jgi:hypothetical protein